MPLFEVELNLDGYDSAEEMEKACKEFIYDQLNFSASSVKVKKIDTFNDLIKEAQQIGLCEDEGVRGVFKDMFKDGFLYSLSRLSNFIKKKNKKEIKTSELLGELDLIKEAIEGKK